MLETIYAFNMLTTIFLARKWSNFYLPRRQHDEAWWMIAATVATGMWIISVGEYSFLQYINFPIDASHRLGFFPVFSTSYFAAVISSRVTYSLAEMDGEEKLLTETEYNELSS